MNSRVKFVFYCAFFVFFIGVAVWGYDVLKEYDLGSLSGMIDTSSGDVFQSVSGDASGELVESGDVTLGSGDVKVYPKARDFEVVDSNGDAVRLSDFYGKPIVVNFWASWCNPCKYELPDFEKAYKSYGGDVEFLMVNLSDAFNDSRKDAEKLISKNGFTFPVYYDTKAEAAVSYGIYSIPQTMFIDKDANVIAGYMGMIDETMLENGILRIMN